MGDLKPIGSEKLIGQDKLNRIMEIARFKEVIPNSINETAKNEYSISLADGNNYRIIKERQGYIIKKSISESQSDYIEPMKNRKYYSSYSQAFKRLNLLAGELNRLNENEEGTSLYGEQKKFVLKTPKKTSDEISEPKMDVPMIPPPVPSPELPPSPDSVNPNGMPQGGMPDEGMPDEGMPDEGMPDEGMPQGGMPDEGMPDEEMPDEEMSTDELGPNQKKNMGSEKDSDEQVNFKTIQKLTGRLSQKIRTLSNEDGMTSENMKYVINMILSSLDLDHLSDEDKEDIISKFEENDGDEDMGDENEMEYQGGEEDMSPMGSEEQPPIEPNEMYTFGESRVDNIISNYFEFTKKEVVGDLAKKEQKKRKRISEVRKNMEEVMRLTETVEQAFISKKYLTENDGSVFVGKTNMNNLVFENKGKQVKVSPEGFLR
jgi:hypothetical protein